MSKAEQLAKVIARDKNEEDSLAADLTRGGALRVLKQSRDSPLSRNSEELRHRLRLLPLKKRRHVCLVLGWTQIQHRHRHHLGRKEKKKSSRLRQAPGQMMKNKTKNIRCPFGSLHCIANTKRQEAL